MMTIGERQRYVSAFPLGMGLSKSRNAKLFSIVTYLEWKGFHPNLHG